MVVCEPCHWSGLKESSRLTSLPANAVDPSQGELDLGRKPITTGRDSWALSRWSLWSQWSLWSPWQKPLMQELQSLWFDVSPPVDALVQERPAARLQRLGKPRGRQDLSHHWRRLALAQCQGQQWSTTHARTQVRNPILANLYGKHLSWTNFGGMCSSHQPNYLPRYASHLGLPAVMLQLHGTNHTNLARFEFSYHVSHIFLWSLPEFCTTFGICLLRLVSNHIAKGANFQVWVQVNFTQFAWRK